VLVDVDPHVQRLGSTQHHQRRFARSGSGELAHAQFHLQDLRVDRRTHRAPLDLHGRGADLGFGGRDLRPGFVQLGSSRVHRRPPPGQLFSADRALVLHLLDERELTSEIVETRIRDSGARAGDRERLPAHVELCPEMPRVQLEERVARADRVSSTDEHLGNDAGQGRADGNVLRARLDQANRGDGIAEIRDGRRRRGIVLSR